MNRKRFIIGLVATLLSLTVAISGFATEGTSGGTSTGTAASGDRTGAWVDEVVFIAEGNSAAGITRMQAGEFQIYADVLDAVEDVSRVNEDPDLYGITAYGLYNEITFNTTGDPTFPNSGEFNPFSNAKIREAMNRLVDREYIAEEIYAGLGVPRYTTISPAFPDYSRYIDVIRALELKYAYDKDSAEATIADEMEAMGATKVGGKWQFDGEDVMVIALIRVEDKRREIGDYVANQLEDIGFTVDRQYKTSSEAAPIWVSGDPNDGLFHYYTGGWISNFISRDQGGNFDFFFTPRGYSVPLWQNYTPSAAFDEVAQRLGNNDFADLEERAQLFREALPLSMEDSSRMFMIQQTGAAPVASDVSIAADLAASISGGELWPYTLRYNGEVGGSITVALPDALTEPWNPIDGSNWVYDAMMQRGTEDGDLLADPYTGLRVPNRIASATVTTLNGTPLGKTLDWIDVDFVSEVSVPADAWADWNATAQEFITVGEKNPDGLTAKTKVELVYVDDMYERTWHDGSQFSIADLLMGLIMTFDPGDPESAIYDEIQAAPLENFKSTFRGFRVTDTDPITIEYYTDLTDLDAETLAQGASNLFVYGRGTGALHNIGLGVRAEAAEKLAFGTGKADVIEAEWANYIAGPSLDILADELDAAIAENYIPYEPTLGEFITASEMRTRYQNLKAWYEDKNHFWIGMGTMYLEEAFPVEKQLVMKRFEDYIGASDRFSGFGQPPIATVETDGPSRVAGGSAAEFTINVSMPDGSAYAAGDIDAVKYLLFNASGELVKSGNATGGAGGAWTVALSGSDTSGLGAGSSRIEVAVAPKIIAIPTFDAVSFTTTQ